MTGTRVLEVWADVVCPFTHVGLRRLTAQRDALGRDLRLRARAWPLEWVNGAPVAPEVVAEEIEALRGSVAADLFTGFTTAEFPATSVPALALASAAYARDVATGEAVSLALRDALFEQGRNVADPAVLRALAADHGIDPAAIDPDAVRAEYDDGRACGVIGSPYFVVADRGFFCPSLEIRHSEAGFAVRFDAEAFEEFAAVALADPEPTVPEPPGAA